MNISRSSLGVPGIIVLIKWHEIKHLEELNISFCKNLSGGEDCRQKLQNLIQACENLKVLNLSKSVKETFEAVMKASTTTSKIRKIILRENEWVNSEIVKTIGENWKQTVREIDVSGCEKAIV